MTMKATEFFREYADMIAETEIKGQLSEPITIKPTKTDDEKPTQPTGPNAPPAPEPVTDEDLSDVGDVVGQAVRSVYDAPGKFIGGIKKGWSKNDVPASGQDQQAATRPTTVPPGQDVGGAMGAQINPITKRIMPPPSNLGARGQETLPGGQYSYKDVPGLDIPQPDVETDSDLEQGQRWKQPAPMESANNQMRKLSDLVVEAEQFKGVTNQGVKAKDMMKPYKG